MFELSRCSISHFRHTCSLEGIHNVVDVGVHAFQFFATRWNLHFKPEFTPRSFKNFSAKNKVASHESWTKNTYHHWFRSLKPYCAKLTFGCQSAFLIPLWSHALLILEMIRVQYMKWYMKQTSLKGSQVVHIWLAQLDKHETSKTADKTFSHVFLHGVPLPWCTGTGRKERWEGSLIRKESTVKMR